METILQVQRKPAVGSPPPGVPPSVIEVELPDGRVVEVVTTDPQAAAAAAKRFMDQSRQGAEQLSTAPQSGATAQRPAAAPLPPGFVLDEPSARPPRIVTMPDGVPVAFPDDMPPDQIRALILKKFPDAAAQAARPGFVLDAQPDRPPRIIEFQGRRIQVPHDATDDFIREILSSPPAPAPRPSNTAPRYTAANPYPGSSPNAPMNGRQWYEGPATAQPSGPAAPTPDRSQRAAWQGAARSFADTAGLAPDLANIAANAGLAGLDAASRVVGGPAVPFRFSMMSDLLANRASKAAESVGISALDPESMAWQEKLAYNTNRFGGQAALTAGTLVPIAAARATASTATRAPRLGDSIMRAYETAPAKTAAGDTVAGAAAGGALTASQQLPDSVRDTGGGVVGGIADLMAMGLGGLAGSAAATAATSPRRVKDYIRGRFPARDVPYDPDTELPTTNRTADLAARYVQTNAANPEAAASSIRAGADEFRSMGVPTPGIGALSNDPKLLTLERAQRSSQPGAFAERDVALHDAALGAVESIQPRGIDPRLATNHFRDDVSARTGAAASAVRAAEVDLATAEHAQRATADAVRPYAGRSAAASEDLDQTILNKSLAPMDAKRKADFAAIPRDVTTPGEPFMQAVERVRASAAHLPDNARAEILPKKWLEDFDTYVIRDAGGNAVGANPISFGVINDLRPILAAEIARARKAGAPVTYLDNLDTLKRELTKATQRLPEAQTALANFEQQYAPIWGRGAGEAYRLRGDFNIDRMNRTASPPSATAGRFLTTGPGAPEKAAALGRIVDSLPDPTDRAAAAGAVRQYVLADLTKTIGADGKISETAMARWFNGPHGWNDALSPFPGLRAEVTQTLTDVRKGNAQRNALALDVERASVDMRRTQRDVDNSALSLTLGKEPVKAARSVLDSGDPKMAMREIVSSIGGNNGVRLAWERAVTDHLVDRISMVRPGAVSEGTTAIDFSRLTKTMKQYEDALGELYASQPDKMNALRRAQRLLEPMARRASGSAPAELNTGTSDSAWKLLEVALKAHYGILKGGGVLRTLKIASQLTKNDAVDVQRLTSRMMFDPELAEHLLTRKTKEVGAPEWNHKLAKLLRRAEVGRELLGGEDE